MRISDWSSDVCSSDLDREHPEADGERDPELDDPEEAEEWTEVIERDSLGSKRKRLQPRKRLGFRRPGCLVGTGFDYPRFFELDFPGGARRLLLGVQQLGGVPAIARLQCRDRLRHISVDGARTEVERCRDLLRRTSEIDPSQALPLSGA